MSLFLLSCATTALPSAGAVAAQVRGVVDIPVIQAPSRTLGYTRTRVAAPGRAAYGRKAPTALFLMVRESLPIPPPSEAFRVAISGLRIEPAVAACVVDGKLNFTNEDPAPVTILIDRTELARLAPGESKIYECNTADPSLRRIRVKEWPHIRGSLFVGEVGIITQPNASGAFAITAPQGKYDLKVIGEDGVAAKQDVTIGKTDVDLGHIAMPVPSGAIAAGPDHDPSAARMPPRADAPAKANAKAPPGKARPPAKAPPPGVKPKADQDTTLHFETKPSGQ